MVDSHPDGWGLRFPGPQMRGTGGTQGFWRGGGGGFPPIREERERTGHGALWLAW